VDFDCDSEIAVDTSAIFHQQRRPGRKPVVVDTAANIDAGTYANRIFVLRGETARKKQRKKKENRKMESQIIQRITKQNNDPKFKKLVAKAEKALNRAAEEY